MMDRIDYQSIGDVLRQSIDESCMREHLDECRAADMWAAVVGPEIAASTCRPSVARGVMTVVCRYAPLRQELMMNRSRLRRAINAALGREVVSEIRFTNS